jgi:hypothetical protein
VRDEPAPRRTLTARNARDAQPSPAVAGVSILTMLFIKEYKRFLLRFVDLKDCSYLLPGGRRNRFTNEELEEFRSDPTLPYVEREGVRRRPCRIYRGAFTPTLDDLESHRLLQGERTIFVSNKANSPFLMMLADIDDKAGAGDPDGAAAYLSEAYLGGRTVIEASTGGRGRHVYFIVDAGRVRRDQVVDAFRRFAGTIQEDTKFSQAFGVTFDQVFYGLPTLWRLDSDGKHRIELRGNAMRLPYVSNGEPDLSRLETLASAPLAIGDLLGFLDRCVTPISPRPVEGEQKRAIVREAAAKRRDGQHAASDGGDRRRARCVRINMLRNPNVTAEECLNDYKGNYEITPDNNTDEQRLADFRRMLRKFRVARPRALTGERYLPLITRIVPAEELIWARREKLDHKRLADFVAVKLQDAFFEKHDGYFAMASRDATLKNFRKLKEKGQVDWICTSHHYTKLLDVACRYDLLHVYEEYVRPTRRTDGSKLLKGTARVIGPGKALPEEQVRFTMLYRAWKLNRSPTL